MPGEDDPLKFQKVFIFFEMDLFVSFYIQTLFMLYHENITLSDAIIISFLFLVVRL